MRRRGYFRLRPWLRLGLRLGLGLAVVGIAAPSRTARACSCLPPPAPGVALEQADVVFEGRPYAAAVEGGQTRYSFEVDRFWKGELGDRVDVETASSSAACGRNYEIGTPYVVYARRVSAAVLGDTLCSRTRTTMAAEEDLEVLGAPRSPDEAPRGERPDPDAPPREPPRISTADPSGPSPTTPSRRGCAMEMPHTPSGAASALMFSLGLLVAATRRRRRAVIRSESGSTGAR